MIILNKNKIYNVIMCTIFTLLVFYIGNNVKNRNTVPTVALPTTNKVIVIDAGHGKPDERC